MPTRPDASAEPQRQSVKLVAGIAVLGLSATVAFALLAFAAPAEAPLRRWGFAAVAVAGFVAALIAHRRLRAIRWRRLMKED
jgi:membrane protein YdbS with pleckstrin-like domain